MKEERHLSKTTVETKLRNLRRLRKRVNIWDIDSVRRYIAGSEWGNNYKSIMEYMYLDWCRFNGFDYKLTKYPKDTKIPYVPLEKDIDILIAGFKNSKYAPMLQLLKESGFRPIEAFRLTPNDFDLEQRICTLNKPAKHSLPRQFKMTDKLVAMMTPLIKKTLNDKRIWNGKPKHIKRNFNVIRKNIVEKLGNPRIEKVSLGSLRHFVGTMTYHKTKDIFYTQQALGHKNIQNTMVYVHMISFESDDWVCKVASSLKE
ncbi:MAG: site-specific integrase, partial [Candidatus Bathyarchaeia archaeon]